MRQVANEISAKTRDSTSIRVLFGVLAIGFTWLLWELAGWLGLRFVRILPPPSQFLKVLASSNFKIGLGSQAVSIEASIAASFFRVLTGLAVGFVLSIVMGFLISTNRLSRLLLVPIVRLLAPIAPIAWIPLGLVLLGIGNQTAIFIVVMGVFFTLTIATMQAIEDVPDQLLNNARCLGCTDYHLWRYVILPAILPTVFTALRLNFIAAWMAVLAAEMTGLQDGLGAIIMIGRNLFDNNLILLGMCLIGMTGFAGDLILKFFQKRYFWWGDK